MNAAVADFDGFPRVTSSGPVAAASFQQGSLSLPSTTGAESVVGTRNIALLSGLLSAAGARSRHRNQHTVATAIGTFRDRLVSFIFRFLPGQ